MIGKDLDYIEAIDRKGLCSTSRFGARLSRYRCSTTQCLPQIDAIQEDSVYGNSKYLKLQTLDAFNCLRPWHWFCEVLTNQNIFHWLAVARWCHVAAPHHHVDHVDLGQHDDNVAFVYLLRLHPLLGHLLRAKLNESKPSWGTYPTMVAELISGNVGCMSGRNRKFDQFQISWPPFFTTCLLQPDF